MSASVLEGDVDEAGADPRNMSGVWEDRTALECSCNETRFVVFGLSHRTHMGLSHGTRNVTSSRYGLSIYHSTQYDCANSVSVSFNHFDYGVREPS